MATTMVKPDVVYKAQEGEQFNADTTLHVVDCPSCHVTYAIPQTFYEAAREHNSAANPNNYWAVCCPFGHSWHYTGLNQEQRLKQNLKWEREHAARMAAQRDQARADAHAQKSAKTRFKNQRDRERKRAAAGVCPCCNRTFKQLARHMENQHPHFTSDAD